MTVYVVRELMAVSRLNEITAMLILGGWVGGLERYHGGGTIPHRCLLLVCAGGEERGREIYFRWAGAGVWEISRFRFGNDHLA